MFCPGTKIKQVVAEWVISGFLSVIEAAVALVLNLWSVFREAFGAAGGDVFEAVRLAAEAFEDAITEITTTMTEFASSSGLAGPVVSVLVFVVVIVGTVALLRGLLGVLRRVRIWII